MPRSFETRSTATTELLIVFEDDATIEPGFNNVLLDTMRHVPSDWIGLWLGSHCSHEGQYAAPHASGKYVTCRGQMQCHAYILNREGIRQSSAWLEVRKQIDLVDIAYAKLHRDDPRFFGPPRWISNRLSILQKRRTDDFLRN